MLTKIAIIEDDPMIAQLLCTWLAPYRYVCECFHSGEAFLAYDWQSAGFNITSHYGVGYSYSLGADDPQM